MRWTSAGAALSLPLAWWCGCWLQSVTPLGALRELDMMGQGRGCFRTCEQVVVRLWAEACPSADPCLLLTLNRMLASPPADSCAL